MFDMFCYFIISEFYKLILDLKVFKKIVMSDIADNIENTDVTLDSVIQDFETRLNIMYETKDEKEKGNSSSSSSQQVFPVEYEEIQTLEQTEPEISKEPVNNTSNNNSLLQYLYIVIPLLIAAILYYFKPKRIMKGSKIDTYKYTKFLFILTFVSWGAIFLALNFSGK
jgi:ATP-dependent Zn protease